jgi:hypothetical protein
LSASVAFKWKQISNYNADSNAGEPRSGDFATLASTGAAHSSSFDATIRVLRRR